jgi:CheY-like chemotaxis protein
MISRAVPLPKDLHVPKSAIKILLVDDTPENLISLEAALENLGEVVLAHSGKDALRHLLEGRLCGHPPGRQDAGDGRVSDRRVNSFPQANASHTYLVSYRLPQRRAAHSRL